MTFSGPGHIEGLKLGLTALICREEDGRLSPRIIFVTTLWRHGESIFSLCFSSGLQGLLKKFHDHLMDHTLNYGF